MRFWTLLVVLVYVHASDAARTVTNEDIRDAILSVVNMIRSTEDKLERHEFRERTLGDQIKKALSTIDKRQRLLDPVKGTIGRLDERLASVETILLQKDERERIQMQKVFDMVEQIHNSLPQLFETLKNDITSSLPKESEEPSPSKVDLEKLQKEIEHKIDNTSSNVKNLEGQLSKIREENKNNFSSNQKFLEKYQNKLTEYNKQIDVLPAKCKEVNDVQTDVILKALETQSNNIKKLQKDTDASNALVKSFEKKLSELQGDAKNNQRLNDSTSQNLENVKKHINNSQEVLKKYEAKLNEYNKKIDVLPATYKNENEAQTKSILKALENHSETVRRHVENQTVSSRDILNTIEVRLGKLHENDQEHTVISSGIKDDINATQQLVSDYYEKIHKQCNNRSSLSDILQALQDHSANTTDFQKQLENKLRSLSQEQLGNLTALINATRKDTDSGVLKEISTLTNDTYFKIIEVFDKHDEKNSKIQESMKMIEDLTEVLNGNIAISFERLIDEIQTLQKLEEVMAQTSDSVTDTKRRVEHGVREISMEIGNLIKSQMQDLNASVDARFNNLQSSLMDIDNGAIANISTSLTNDLDHVWRQIGIMHQEVSMITDLLNKLDHNTQRYINGTTRNVDITRGKVTQMQSSISQIDHNLNTLLGRFSLITQEFNLIKLNVGNALNEIKRTLQNSPPKNKPTGPGPHIINSI